MIWLLLACSGEEPEANWNGHEPVENETADTGPDLYGTQIQPIWNERCIRCHGIQFTSAQLDLTLDEAELLDVASDTLPEMDRVEPGSLEDSFLWHKLRGTHVDLAATGMGETMPQGEGPLDEEQIALVESWIESL